MNLQIIGSARADPQEATLKKSIAKTGALPANSGPMPQSLTWNSGLAWNTPGATWNGTASSKPNIMTQDLIALDISDADWTAIDAALTTLEEKLGAKLLDLTVEQRSRLTKMGDKSEAFCRQALVTGRQNAGKLPTDTAADLAAEEADLAALDKLRPRLARLTALTEKADDSEIATGSDIMVFSLTLYGILKAIGAGGGLDALKAQMGARFARGPKAPPPAPPAP